jgi:hypothetical protein
MRAIRSTLLAGSLVLAAGAAQAAVLCTTKGGTVKLRPTACKKKETPVDPTAIGLPVSNVVDVPASNSGDVDVLSLPGFGTLIIESGGCSTLLSIEAASPVWVNGTATDQDVSSFSFGPNSGNPTIANYAVAMPGAETYVGAIAGRNGYMTLRVQQRTSAAQATIDVFFANGGDAGEVCKVSARAVVTPG